jgi:hypothetical protein
MVSARGVRVMKSFQHEMPVIGTCFNLAPETGVDIDRVLEEQRKALAAECAGKEFHAKMQRTLAECPGFIGGDLPKAITSSGRVIIEPSKTLEAMKWLKRRFQVAENLEVSPDNGLAIDILPRNPRAVGKRHKFQGRRAEQYQLQF